MGRIGHLTEDTLREMIPDLETDPEDVFVDEEDTLDDPDSDDADYDQEYDDGEEDSLFDSYDDSEEEDEM